MAKLQKRIKEPSTLQTVSEYPCDLRGMEFFNGTAAVAFLQLFDARLATDVTLGTTVATRIVGIPSGGMWSHEYVNMPRFSKGLILAATTENDNATAPTYSTGSVVLDGVVDIDNGEQ